MKKYLFLLALAFAFLVPVTPVLAAKPADNHAGARVFGWHLSGHVMPIPPYGSMDILGSDTASKLIANKPNGKVTTNLTGIMRGLLPNSLYTVFLSNPYSPYLETWNLAGAKIIDFELDGSHYIHDAALTQVGSDIDGTGGYPAGGPFAYEWDITSASVTGNSISLTMDYTAGAVGTTMTMTGTIAPDGSIVGAWSDNYLGATRNGTWTAAPGTAVVTHTGDMSWTGLLPSVAPFTFMTNGDGQATWHYNFKGTDPSALSVWINGAGATVLISDSISF